MNEKVVFVCSANCQDRYGSTDLDIKAVRDAMQERGYDVRTKGCLGICNLDRQQGNNPADESVVSVELHNGGGQLKLGIAGICDGVVGVQTLQVKNQDPSFS